MEQVKNVTVKVSSPGASTCFFRGWFAHSFAARYEYLIQSLFSTLGSAGTSTIVPRARVGVAVADCPAPSVCTTSFRPVCFGAHLICIFDLLSTQPCGHHIIRLSQLWKSKKMLKCKLYRHIHIFDDQVPLPPRHHVARPWLAGRIKTEMSIAHRTGTT